VLFGNSRASNLTKDLFFSGHVATTVILLLYLWRGAPCAIWRSWRTSSWWRRSFWRTCTTPSTSSRLRHRLRGVVLREGDVAALLR